MTTTPPSNPPTKQPLSRPLPWWDRSRHEDRRPALLARNRIKAALQSWFASEDFIEVDPAALQVSPGNEAHLHAFTTTERAPDGSERQMHLHTSPEFAMKKLLAAGEDKIFAFAHVYRNRELSPLHASEFTMLEWYRTGAPYDQLMSDAATMLGLAAKAAGTDMFRWQDKSCDPFAPPERLPLAEAVSRYAGIDLLATIADDGAPDADALASAMRSQGLRVAEDDTWSDLLSAILVAKVEPHLGMGRATILDRYPAVEAALARRTPDDLRVAERFEIYACGVELANGFGELTDAPEQRRRFEAEMDEKERVYGHRYPLDEDFLEALAQMPNASGIALGFDRLVLLATGAPRLSEVMWAPPG